ncbi:MAG: hypothetical protein Q9169_005841 [Polycauliona sp. 2 TL-2023]
MPTVPSDSRASTTFSPSSHTERNTYITCPPEDVQNPRSEHGPHTPPRRHGIADLVARQPGPARSPTRASAPPTQADHSYPPLRKMPTWDDEEGYVSSSVESGEVTESSSSIATAPPARSEQSQSPMPMQQDLTRFPEASNLGFRLPRVRRVDGPPGKNAMALTVRKDDPSLTKDHPTLTTYFDGEIIGPKYTFQTRHPSWGATDKTDMQHWNRFPAWRQLGKQAKKPDFHYKNFTQRENIFMRWKESFLVPDHRVREILGASFEGFYYICFNQISGDISGIYFHAKSEKYQQLELKHVDDRGCFPAIEFR